MISTLAYLREASICSSHRRHFYTSYQSNFINSGRVYYSPLLQVLEKKSRRTFTFLVVVFLLPAMRYVWVERFLFGFIPQRYFTANKRRRGAIGFALHRLLHGRGPTFINIIKPRKQQCSYSITDKRLTID